MAFRNHLLPAIAVLAMSSPALTDMPARMATPVLPSHPRPLPGGTRAMGRWLPTSAVRPFQARIRRRRAHPHADEREWPGPGLLLGASYSLAILLKCV
jgi:hypothetical protein